MAEEKIAATLFAAGPHVPLSSLALAMAFLVVRLTAMVILPGYVLYRLVRVAISWREAQTGPQVDRVATATDSATRPL
jgi:hypothetical protein